MQLVVIALGVGLVLVGLYFAVGGFGQSRVEGGVKSITLEAPAWLLVMLTGVGMMVFGAIWDWNDDDSGAAPPPTTTAPPVTTAAPPVTTAAPPVTTAAPPVTTAAPPVTTAAPPVTTAAPPVTTAAPPGPCVPEPISPRESEILDNGRTDRDDLVEWRFSWIECPDADAYQLVVLGPSATLPLIDEALSIARYDHRSEGSFIADSNRLGWIWRVRARTDGEWGAWYEGNFDVEPVDTDQ